MGDEFRRKFNLWWKKRETGSPLAKNPDKHACPSFRSGWESGYQSAHEEARALVGELVQELNAVIALANQPDGYNASEKKFILDYSGAIISKATKWLSNDDRM